jgi:DNA-binding NarL/FixJ family response regulator
MGYRAGSASTVDVEVFMELSKKGCPAAEIAERLQVTTRTVSRLRIKHGLSCPRPENARKVTPEWHVKVQELLKEGYSHRAIADIVGSTTATIARHYPGTAWKREQISELGAAMLHLSRIPDKLEGARA